MEIIFRGNRINHYNATLFERYVYYECGGYIKRAIFSYHSNPDGSYEKDMKTRYSNLGRVEDWPLMVLKGFIMEQMRY